MTENIKEKKRENYKKEFRQCKGHSENDQVPEEKK